VPRHERRAPYSPDFLLSALRQLGRRELTFTQLVAMHYLAEHPGAPIGDVATAIDRSRPATGRLIEDLVRAGLAVREEAADDRRVKRVRLTAKARTFLAGLRRGHSEDASRHH